MSQSPLSRRGGGPDHQSKGTVKTTAQPINKTGGEANVGAWQHQGKTVSSQKDC